MSRLDLVIKNRRIVFNVGKAQDVPNLQAPKDNSDLLANMNTAEVGEFGVQYLRNLIESLPKTKLVKASIQCFFEFTVSFPAFDARLTISPEATILQQAIACNQYGTLAIEALSPDALPKDALNISDSMRIYANIFAPTCTIGCPIPELNSVRTSTIPCDTLIPELAMVHDTNLSTLYSNQVSAVKLALYQRDTAVYTRVAPWQQPIPLNQFRHLTPCNELDRFTVTPQVTDNSTDDCVDIVIRIGMKDQMPLTIQVVKVSTDTLWKAMPRFIQNEHTPEQVSNIARQQAAKLAYKLI